MAKAPQRASVQGPAFIRLLARLTDVDVPQSNLALSDRLSQWIDWNRAIALSKALDGTPATAANGPAFDSSEDDACIHVRSALVQAIDDALAVAVAQQRDAQVLAEDTGAQVAMDGARLRQCHLSLQRKMLAATGQLRGRLQDMLSRTSADMARLAELDALMELTLSPREQALLATVPALLGEHFERLRDAAQTASAEAAVSGQPPAATAGAWLDVFHKDMQAVLLAELDVRFQPIEGLLAALRTR